MATAAELQLSEYGAVVSSAPVTTPSIANVTPTTPVSSSAVACRVTVPATVAPACGAVTDAVGGVVSGGALKTVTVTGADVAVLPAASRAVALSTWLPLFAARVSHATP